jgi:uncharacterized alpha-E superfamily protein
MLSRVADALFWMSRYLERAEHVALLLDVCFHLELDLRGVLSAPSGLHWTSLAVILQQSVPAGKSADLPPHVVLSHWLTFDLENPSSILSCVNRARNNARSIRGTISSEMWRELNKLYWKLSDPAFNGPARESPHDYYETVACGSHAFQGVCDATMTHDEGWHFIQLGKFLERADKTLRILDVLYHLLRELTDPMDLPLLNLHWAAVLRSCRAYEAYQRLYAGRVEPERVVEFLLLHPNFPRSVRFSLEESARALTAIEGPDPNRGFSEAGRILGRVLSDLKFSEAEQVLRGDLHVFLTGVLEQCARVGWAMQKQYALQ